MILTLYKALADPTRLRLIAILVRGEFTVQELVEILAMGQSRVSRHLKILHEAGVVRVKREGTWAYYRLASENQLIADQLPMLRSHLEELPDVRTDAEAIARVLARRRERSQTFFDAHASRWDELARELVPTPDYQAQLFASIAPCSTLVEVGVGTGALLEHLSDRADTLIGIDHSPAMLKAARERVGKLQLDKIELRLGEMEHLPVEAASVDGLVLHMVLHHAPAPEIVLREAARVLRSGGQVTIVDLLRHQQEWVRDRLADQWLGFVCSELAQWCDQCDFVEVDCTEVAGCKQEYAIVICQARRR